MSNDTLRLPADVTSRLAKLRAEPKFGPLPVSSDFPLGYVGYLPTEDQPLAEAQLNKLIESIAAGIKDNPTKTFVLKQFTDAYTYFEYSDTEDRERFCRYLEDIMDAVGMTSSDGTINRLLYGPDFPL